MALFDSRSEWIVRLPAVVSANITALAVALLAARWFGSRVGLLAGMIQFTLYYTVKLSRLAECDTLLIAAVTSAMCCFAAANVEGPRPRSTARWLPWVFYLAAGLSFLAKGPIGPFIIFSGCGLFLLMNQDLRGLRFFASPLGLALFAWCVVPYPLLAYAAHPPILDAWLLHNKGRFEGTLSGQQPMLYYAYTLPMLLLPWFPLLPLYLWRRRGEGVLVWPLWRFVLCWITPGLIVFSLSAFKKYHYLAPLLPGCSVLLAVALVDYLRRRHRGPSRSYGWFYLLIVAGCGIAIAAVWWGQPRGATAICALVAALAPALLLITWLESRRLFAAHLGAIMATCWLAIAGVFVFIMPKHDTYLDQSRLAERINRLTPPGQPVYMLEMPDSQITYYLEKPVVRLDLRTQFLNRLPANAEGEYYVLGPRKIFAELEAAGQLRILDRSERLIGYMQPADWPTFGLLRRSGGQLAERSITQADSPP
jgi:4-amino-4-deoxy-L-arabinose transferase-like glycosyltransferase